MSGGVRGVGVDTVDLDAFAASLAEPGTRFTDVFSPAERRQCRERAAARGTAAGGMLASSSWSASSFSSPLASSTAAPSGSSRASSSAAPSASSRASSSAAPTDGRRSSPRASVPVSRVDPLARHLAGRWAVKEAVIKAWSAALYGSPPPIAPEVLLWSEIETVCDAWGRPAVRLSGEVARQVAATVGEDVRWNVSLSHDGSSAVAFAVLEA